MQILNDNELDLVHGGIYGELVMMSVAITIGYLIYQTSKIPVHENNDISETQYDAYFDGAMQYLSNGGHCA